jgi:2'-5' RNA ligase
MDKKRIFIAIPIAPEITTKIREFAEKYPSLPVRWLADKNLHITLVPPQELDDLQLQTLMNNLQNVSHSPFEVKFTELSVGPNPSSPRMLWVTGTATPEIESLKSSIEQAAGYHPDRKFLMHITLARFKTEDWEETPALRDLKSSVRWNLLVKKFVVMQSKLTNTQADYTILHEYPLL